MKLAHAIISWVPPGKGGRKAPPSGPTYSAVCRFWGDPAWPQEAWSLVVTRRRAYAKGRYWFADVRFLAPDAPEELLRSGARFELFEGRRLVATGLIRASNARPPVGSSAFQAVLLS